MVTPQPPDGSATPGPPPVQKFPHAYHSFKGIALAIRIGMRTGKAVVHAPADVIEVLDRVLDRGIVIDAWLRVSVAGLQLVDVDARIVVASITTYVRDGDAIAGKGMVSRPSPPENVAKRPKPRRRVARPRPARPRVMLRCANGCTFLRASKRTTEVRCTSDRAQRCAVTPV
jgi:gas vesicle structural protein